MVNIPLLLKSGDFKVVTLDYSDLSFGWL